MPLKCTGSGDKTGPCYHTMSRHDAAEIRGFLQPAPTAKLRRVIAAGSVTIRPGITAKQAGLVTTIGCISHISHISLDVIRAAVAADRTGLGQVTG